MVMFKICTFVYLNVDYHHQEHFFGREWNDSKFQNMRGEVEVMKFWIVCPLKILIFGRSEHLKNSSKILANTFSDSLAILKKKCRLTPANFVSYEDSWFPSRSHNCVWVMGMIIPVPFPYLLKGTHTAAVPWKMRLRMVIGMQIEILNGIKKLPFYASF